MAERTTLSLEDDVAARIRDEVRRSGRPMKDVVNEALRTGLDDVGAVSPEPYAVPSRDLGLRPGIDLDDVRALLDRFDGPART